MCAGIFQAFIWESSEVIIEQLLPTKMFMLRTKFVRKNKKQTHANNQNPQLVWKHNQISQVLLHFYKKRKSAKLVIIPIRKLFPKT